MASLRPELATARTRSALAVPPGFGGFLRASLCRFVAPCSRPWGSPGCGLRSWGGSPLFVDRASVSPRRPSTTRRAPLGAPPRPAEACRGSLPRAEVRSGRQPFLIFCLGRGGCSRHVCRSLWRTTLRSLSLVDSRTASPRPLPPRRCSLWPPLRLPFPVSGASSAGCSTSRPCSVSESVAT
jgi:hypothetical protein